MEETRISGADDAPSPHTGGLTTGGVARRLGVAPTTLRTWDRRYGLGPATREQGRHRRWSEADIAVLEHMCRLTATGMPPAEAARLARTDRPDTRTDGPEHHGAEPDGAEPGGADTEGTDRGTPAADPSAPSPRYRGGGGNALPVGRVRREARGLARASVRLDSPTMDEILHRVITEEGLVTAWEEVIAPTLRAAGRKWASDGERYMEVEHLLSWHVSSAFRRLAPTTPARTDTPGDQGGQPVLLACVPGEIHTLPLEALAAALAGHGRPLRMFGPAVPAGALTEAIRRTGPRAVVLWSQTRETADRGLARTVCRTAWGVRGARTAPRVLLAGPGWPLAPPLPGTLHPHGLREAVDLLTDDSR